MSALNSPNSPYKRAGTALKDLHNMKLLSEEFVRDGSNPSTLLTSKVNMYANRYSDMLTEGTKSVCPVSSNTWSFYLSCIYNDIVMWFLNHGVPLMTAVQNIMAQGEGAQDPTKDIVSLFTTWKDDLTQYKNADTVKSELAAFDKAMPMLNKNAVVIDSDVDTKTDELVSATSHITSDILLRDGINDIGKTFHPTMESWMITSSNAGTGTAMCVANQSVIAVDDQKTYYGSSRFPDSISIVYRHENVGNVTQQFDWFTASVPMTVSLEISIPATYSVMDVTNSAVTVEQVAGSASPEGAEPEVNNLAMYGIIVNANPIPKGVIDSKGIIAHSLNLNTGDVVKLKVSSAGQTAHYCTCRVTGVCTTTPLKVPLNNLIGSSKTKVIYHDLVNRVEEELGVLRNYDTYMVGLGVATLFTKFVTDFNSATNRILKSDNATQYTITNTDAWSINMWFTAVSGDSIPRLAVMYTRWANLLIFIRQTMLMNLQYLRSIAN